MKYSRDGDQVALEMTIDDWETLLLILGYACGAAMSQGDKRRFYGWLQFANELNRTNPKFRPYEIPEEYRREVQS